MKPTEAHAILKERYPNLTHSIECEFRHFVHTWHEEVNAYDSLEWKLFIHTPSVKIYHGDTLDACMAQLPALEQPSVDAEFDGMAVLVDVAQATGFVADCVADPNLEHVSLD